MSIKVYEVGMCSGKRTIVAETMNEVLYAIQPDKSLHHRYKMECSDLNGGKIVYTSPNEGHNFTYWVTVVHWFTKIELFNKVLLDTRSVDLTDLHKVFGNYREIIYNVITQGKYETDNYTVFNTDVLKWRIKK